MFILTSVYTGFGACDSKENHLSTSLLGIKIVVVIFSW